MEWLSNGNALNPEEGRLLIRIARKAISERFAQRGGCEELPEPLPERLTTACCGTFVTLSLDDRLRGCIGTLIDTEPLAVSIRKNAINAAFGDPRFPPLTLPEFERIRIEVSLLSPPEALKYSDADDLLGRLSPGAHGVILRKGAARATFLPQVWKQLPQPEEFLSHLCLKAGLPADTWRREAVEIETYLVRYFEEAPTDRG
ncbi:MAG: AmmeMemoRadiSam system protein A [Desulfobacterales bacterium]